MRTVSINSIEFEFLGATTIAHVHHPDQDILDRLCTVPVWPELVADLVGTGVARCRPEDHYDEDIGRYIAATRAMRHLGKQIEARVIASVVSEQQFQVDQAGEAASDALNDLIGAMNRVLELGGGGQIGSR